MRLSAATTLPVSLEAFNPLITSRRIVISVILAASLALMVWGFTLVRPSNQPVVYKNPAIVSLTPKPGDLVLRETRVGATLVQPYTLAYTNAEGLSIGPPGALVGIPQDQLEIIPGLNQYFFTPGPGKDLSELPVGRVCVGLLIKRVNDAAGRGQNFSWCFQTH